jgi:hypothetical protein
MYTMAQSLRGVSPSTTLTCEDNPISDTAAHVVCDSLLVVFKRAMEPSLQQPLSSTAAAHVSPALGALAWCVTDPRDLGPLATLLLDRVEVTPSSFGRCLCLLALISSDWCCPYFVIVMPSVCRPRRGYCDMPVSLNISRCGCRKWTKVWPRATEVYRGQALPITLGMPAPSVVC